MCVSFETLKQKIKSKIPVLVTLKNTPHDRTHYFVVVYGISRNYVIMHDGQTSNRKVSLALFKTRWRNAGNTALWIDNEVH